MRCKKHENMTDSFKFKSCFMYQLDVQPLQHYFLQLMISAYSHHVAQGGCFLQGYGGGI